MQYGLHLHPLLLCSVFWVHVLLFVFNQAHSLNCIIDCFHNDYFTQMVRTKVYSKLEDESAPIRKKNSYFESCIVGRDSFKETRILGAYSYSKKLYNDTLKLANCICALLFCMNYSDSRSRKLGCCVM